MKYLLFLVLFTSAGWFSYGIYQAVPGDALYSWKEQILGISSVEKVVDGVTSLQDQLADIAEQVQAGTLTNDEAYKLKNNINEKVQALNDSITNAKSSNLSAEEKALVITALQKMQDTLMQYKDTMVELDKKAAKSKRSRGGGSSNTDASSDTATVVTVIEDVIDDLSDYIEDITQGSDENVTDESDGDAMSDQEPDVNADGETNMDNIASDDEVSSTSDDGVIDDQAADQVDENETVTDTPAS